MNKTLSLTLSLFCFSAFAAPTAEPCLKINRSIGITMTRVLTKDLKVPLNELQLAKTKLVLLNEAKIDYAFADYLAKATTTNEKVNAARLKRLRKMYMENNARNLIVELTFFNKQNKKAVFIASSLIDDYECSVAFNGYLIVKREF